MAAVIVSPTRELAAQIHAVLIALLAFHPPSAACLPYLASDSGTSTTGGKKKTSAAKAKMGASAFLASHFGAALNSGEGGGPGKTAAAVLNGMQIVSDTSERRPQTAAPVVVPQLLVGGGSATAAQDVAFFVRQSPNLLIATPGRLVELLGSASVALTQGAFEALVLDEADRLLDLGFRADVGRILARLPKQRRTGLFSASASDAAVQELVSVGLRNPVRVAVRVKSLRPDQRQGGASPAAALGTMATAEPDRRTPASLRLAYVVAPASHKLPALARLLERLRPRPRRTVVFLSTCAAVDYWQHLLALALPPGLQVAVVPLHGKQPAQVRARNFERFAKSPSASSTAAATASSTLLLTTDLAARGLDFPDVDLVVQVDPPQDPKTFLHRCGRAGRAGRKGAAVVMLLPGREEDYVAFLAARKTPVDPAASLDLEPPTDGSSNDSSTAAGVLGDLSAQAAAATRALRQAVRRDRAHHERAQRAFVSWVRSYSKHGAASIFRVADLDWADLADAWGLLRLPKMPELRKKRGGSGGGGAEPKNGGEGADGADEEEAADVARGWVEKTGMLLGADMEGFDWREYAYADAKREEERRRKLEEDDKARAEGRAVEGREEGRKRARHEESVAWSDKLEREEGREARRTKRRKKREAERAANMTEEEREKQRKLDEMIQEVRRRNGVLGKGDVMKKKKEKDDDEGGWEDSDDSVQEDEFGGFED